MFNFIVNALHRCTGLAKVRGQRKSPVLTEIKPNSSNKVLNI